MWYKCDLQEVEHVMGYVLYGGWNRNQHAAESQLATDWSHVYDKGWLVEVTLRQWAITGSGVGNTNRLASYISQRVLVEVTLDNEQ